MITGLDLEATVNYTLENDKDNPTIWKIGVIPSYLFAAMSTEAGKNEIEYAYKVLQVALKGWENFNIPFEKTKEKIFNRELDVVPLSILERIPLKVVSELCKKVIEVNQLTDDERKN